MSVKITMPLTFKPGVADAATQGITSMLDDTKKRPGFRSCQIHRHLSDPNKIIMIEEWDDVQDYQNYIAWRTERGDMEAFGQSLAEPPVPEFWDSREVTA